ncbi:MAG: Sua5/YciO/YrdC/YwlC family protein [Kiritimatiellaeota bacterium]|nr:Sua5/YciO/YrdC/YwlC family protein [Kiritimatiellota bacterium]
MRVYKTPLSPSDLAEIAAALAGGAVALIPTDTVYGVAAHPASAGGVAKLYALKRRDASKPIPLLAASVEAVAGSGLRLENAALEAAKKFWPGPLTIILGGDDGVSEGVRVPDSATARELCAAAGGMLRCTSANESGEPPALDAATAAAALPGADILIDGGPATIGVASTVARFTKDGGVEIIRQGAVKIVNG